MSAGTIFISRAGGEKELAATIGRALEKAGYEVILQQWDFPNANFIDQMQSALVSGARVVALLSPEYLQSDFCEAEWSAVLADDPLNRKRRLIVLRVAECQPPGLLRTIAFWDLVPVLEMPLLEDIVIDALRPDHRDDTATPSATYRRTGESIVDREAIYAMPSFVGRDDELAALDEMLWHRGIAAAHGLGGIGKSALAREYAWRNRERYAITWWLNAASEDGIVNDILRLGSMFVRGLADVPERSKAALHVKDVILSGFEKPTLFVFDNLEDERLLAWRPSDNAQALVTSRSSSYGSAVAPVALRGWSPVEAQKYLEREVGRAPLEGSAELVEALGRLPLALAHAAAYLRANRTVDARTYGQRVDRYLKQTPRGADYPNAVFATFQTAISDVEGQSPGSAGLLSLASFFAPDGIPDALFRQSAERYPQSLRATVSDGVAVDEALGALDRLSLIEYAPEPRSFSVHRLVQNVARDLLGEDAQGWAASAVGLVEPLFPSAEFSNWAECERLVSHARSALDASAPASGSEAAGALAFRSGDYLAARSQFPAAEAVLRRALAEDEAAFGPEHPSVARDLNGLAFVLYETNRWAEAEDVARRALSIDEKALGSDHPDVARDLNGVGLIVHAGGRYPEAEALFRSALAIAVPHYGAAHPNVSFLNNNLALALQEEGRLDEAEALYRQALEIARSTRGADHPDVALALNNLACILVCMDRSGDAEGFYCQARDIAERSLGPADPLVARILVNYGDLILSAGRGAEAEPLVLRALAIREAAIVRDDKDIANVLAILGGVLAASGRTAEAEAAYRRALERAEASAPAGSAEIACALNNLAGLLYETGRAADAEPVLQRARGLAAAGSGYREHARLAVIDANLARLGAGTPNAASAAPWIRLRRFQPC